MPKFNLPITTAISAAMLACAACGNREWQTSDNVRVCVDSAGNRIPEDRCYSQPYDGYGYSPYRWYYISRGGYVPYYNYPVSGGSWTPSPAGGYQSAPAAAPAGAVTRGGFGGIGADHAGGGEGGGE